MSNDGRLVRVKLKFERDFTQIPNEWLRDSDLSLKARGLLSLLLSHHEGYTVTVKGLVATNKEGRDAMDGAVAELKENDYLRHDKERDRQGRITGIVWTLTDPAEVKKRRSELEPLFPTYGLSHMPETQHPDNPHLKEAQVKEHLPTELKNDTIDARGNEEDALPRDSHPVATETPAERYRRLIAAKCPGRGQSGKPHVWLTSGYCEWCGDKRPELEDDSEPVLATAGADA